MRNFFRWLRTLGCVCGPAYCLFLASVVTSGCRAKPAPAPVLTVADLNFPVVVVFERSGAYVHRSAEDLMTMSMQAVIMSNSPPHLIDNEFNLFRLDKLNSTKGTLAYMLSAGAGSTEVTFELARVPEKSDEQVRSLLRKLEDPWMTDEQKAELLKVIASAKSVHDIVDVSTRRDDKSDKVEEE